MVATLAHMSKCGLRPGNRRAPDHFSLKGCTVASGSSRLPAEGAQEKHNVKLSPVAWRPRFQPIANLQIFIQAGCL
jgi:hypothetical protein